MNPAGWGWTWLDWIILAWVLLFALGGLARGTVAQSFSFLGLFTGLWTVFPISYWLEDQWSGAQPALVFFALRWIVSVLAGLAVASLFQWWGDQLGRAVQASPAAWLDRSGGLLVGLILGTVTVAMAMMVALLVPQPRVISQQVARASSAVPLMSGAAHACSLSARIMPGGLWLEERFRKAQRRVVEVRNVEPHAKRKG